jgi:hypothetical protein
LRGEVDGLLAGAAHPVQGNSRNGDRKTGEHHRETTDVGALLPGLGYGTVHDVLHLLRAYTGPFDEPREDAGEQGVGPHLAEGAATVAERGADGFDYHRLFHALLLTMRSFVIP